MEKVECFIWNTNINPLTLLHYLPSPTKSI